MSESTRSHDPLPQASGVTTTFVLQRKEPNPHQAREALTKNRTFHAWRWKDVAVISNATREQAMAACSDWLAGDDYRLEQR